MVLFIMLIFFPDTNCPSCKTSPPQEGHIHTAHLCERQLPCLKKDHQLSKTLKISPDSFLKPSTKELRVIHKWGRSSLAKGSANLPWPLQVVLVCTHKYLSTYSHTGLCVLGDTHDQEDQKRTNGMPLDPQGW